MRIYNGTKLIGLFVNNVKYYSRSYTNMPYCSTGAVHHSGVGNEKNVVSLLNEIPTMHINRCISSRVCAAANIPPVWSHLGGTKQKADCSAQIGDKQFPVSIKHHQKSGGTFDWINTSKLVEFNPALNEVIKPSVAEFKTKYTGCSEVTKDMRSEMEDIFNDSFDHITSEQVKSLLSSLYEKYPEYVLINDRSKDRLVMYHKMNNFKEFVGYGDWEYYLKTTRAKSSRMIFRRKDGVDQNTNLRIRLVLNNGVNALVGLSANNKCSIPCLKIQQDRVDILLKDLVEPVIDEIQKPADDANLRLLAEVASRQ
jgi:hypothetical protein